MHIASETTDANYRDPSHCQDGEHPVGSPHHTRQTTHLRSPQIPVGGDLSLPNSGLQTLKKLPSQTH